MPKESRTDSAAVRKGARTPTVPKHIRTDWLKEGDLQAYVLQRLRRLPGVRAFKTIRTNEAGVSDIILCVWGRYAVVELKKNPKEKPTELQKLFIESVHEAGGQAEVAYSWDQIAHLLASMGYDTYDNLLQELPKPKAGLPRHV